jgi:threonine dehydratase
MGMEIVDQVPDVEAVVVPVGGAGLIAGVSLALKTLKPDVIVIVRCCSLCVFVPPCCGCDVELWSSLHCQGAEPENVPSLAEALKAGRPVMATATPTLADGLLVPMVGTNAFALAKKHVDRWVCLLGLVSVF